MGSRFSARVPRVKKATQTFARCADHGIDGDGNTARPQRHCRSIASSQRAVLRREFQSCKLDLPRRSKIVALRTSAQVDSRPAWRERHRLLCEQKDSGFVGSKVEYRWSQSEAISYEARVDGSGKTSGAISAPRC